MKIYLASSWRNQGNYPQALHYLRQWGHDVYDFKREAFAWKELGSDWENWNQEQFRAALSTDKSKANFQRDMTALENCDACVMVLPCGKSAHLELGWAVGAKKKSYVLQMEPTQPELMYLMCDKIIINFQELEKEFKHGNS